MFVLTLFAVLTVAAAVTLALILQSIVYRRMPSAHAAHVQETVGDLFIQPISGLYGVLVAFLLANQLTLFDQLRTDITKEFNAIIELARVSQALPETPSTAIRTAIRGYVDSLIRVEWPLLGERRFSNETSAALSVLWGNVLGYAPTSAGESNLHAKALDLLDIIASQRRIRLLAANRRAPPIVWAVLILGAVITIGLGTFSAMPSRRLQSLFVACLAATIGLALFVFAALDRPFAVEIDLFGPGKVQDITELIRAM